MKNIQPGLKKLIAALSQYGNRISWLASLLIIIIALIFLYNNFYQAAGDARVLSSLKTQAATRVVDMDLWQKINRDMEWKKQPLQNGALKNNPFE